MNRACTFGLVIAALALAACTGEVRTTPQASGSAAASGTGGSGTTSSSGGGAGGAGTGGQAGAAGIGGHYMQQVIGNCINFELWLSFGPAGSFTHTLVERDFCAPHGVVVSPGSYALSGPTLDLDWSNELGAEHRRFTFVHLDPYLAEPVGPPIPGYQPGTAALHTQAYARTGAPLVWHREDRSTSKGAGGSLWSRDITVDLTFSAPLGLPDGPTACAMTVDITASTQTDEALAPATGKETFVLPCTYDLDPALPWIRIAADGFDSPWDSKWSDYLGAQGIWKKYPVPLSEAIAHAFRPVLHYVPGDDSRLFHDVWSSAYQEMMHAPPTSVE